MAAIPARDPIPQAESTGAAELLESLLAERAYRPAHVSRLHAREDLPRMLWPICERAQGPTGAWAAWSLAGQVWLVAVQQSMAHSRLQGRPVLQYLVYDGAGRQIAAGVIAEGQPGRWEPLQMHSLPEELVGTPLGTA